MTASANWCVIVKADNDRCKLARLIISGQRPSLEPIQKHKFVSSDSLSARVLVLNVLPFSSSAIQKADLGVNSCIILASVASLSSLLG